MSGRVQRVFDGRPPRATRPPKTGPLLRMRIQRSRWPLGGSATAEHQDNQYRPSTASHTPKSSSKSIQPYPIHNRTRFGNSMALADPTPHFFVHPQSSCPHRPLARLPIIRGHLPASHQRLLGAAKCGAPGRRSGGSDGGPGASSAPTAFPLHELKARVDDPS